MNKHVYYPQCSANVTEQPEFMLLIVGVGTVIGFYWSLRMPLQRYVKCKCFILKPIPKNEWASYVTSILSFIMGQCTAYTMNLAFSTVSEVLFSQIADAVFDPLSVYIAILIQDDLISSIFRFGLWSSVFTAMRHACNMTHLTENKEPLLGEPNVFAPDHAYCIFKILAWCTNVIISCCISMTISTTMTIMLKEDSPSILLSTVFSEMDFDGNCVKKMMLLGVTIRAILESLHMTFAPILIRYFSK